MSAGLLVVGAGPAGISAALRAHGLELPVTLLDAGARPGGQLFDVHFHPADVPGFEHGTGEALAAAYARQLAAARIPVRGDVLAEALEHDAAGAPVLRLASGERLTAGAVLIATGVRRRRLDVPGEREFEGRGVTYSGTRDREWLAGKRVAVVGGGDAAFENALLLAAADCEVRVLVRGEPRARAEFRARVAGERRVRVLDSVRVTAVIGDAAVRAVRIEDPEGNARELSVDGVLVKVGWRANSEWCRDAVACDPEGFVQVDARLATSMHGVWAAGDITRPQPLSIPVALGQGAQAASAIHDALRAR